MLASRVHLAYWASEWQVPYLRMATRHCDLLYGDSLRPAPAGTLALEMKGDRAPWWKRYVRVLDYIRADRELLAPISTRYPDVMAQVLYAVDEEDAKTLADVLLRRLTIGMSAERGRDAAEPVARTLAQRLHWDDDRMRDELAAFDEQIALGAAPVLAEAAPEASRG